MLEFYVSSKLAKVGAWACIAVLIYLSLIPADLEIRTGLPGDFEHVFAYLGTAGAFTLAYPRWSLWLIAGGLAVFSCGLEVMQGYIPGRTALFMGALSSGVGAAIGVLLATKLMALTLPKSYGPPGTSSD